MFDLREAEAYGKGGDNALGSALALGVQFVLKGWCIHRESKQKICTYLSASREGCIVMMTSLCCGFSHSCFDM